MISAPDSPTYERVRQMENLAPRIAGAKALRGHGADRESRHPDRHQHDVNPRSAAERDADPARPAPEGCNRREPGSRHALQGGPRRRFVIAGGLTLADQQRDYFFGVLRDRFPDLLPFYERMYPHPTASYGGIRSGDPHLMGRRIRNLCRQYGISDRMPRPIIPGDKRALNKRIVEALANQCYWLELDTPAAPASGAGNAPGQRVWAYRRAAWAIEDLEQDVGLIYRTMGRKGLEGIENVGPRLAEVVEGLISELSALPKQAPDAPQMFLQRRAPLPSGGSERF
jgi:hypothetical protein